MAKSTQNIDFFKDSDVPNDEIDIYDENPKVSVKVYGGTKQRPKFFKVYMKGKCIDYSFSNAIRIAILMWIPISRFNRDNIEVNRENTYNMYDFDITRIQIESIPLYDLPNDFDLITENNKNKRKIELVCSFKNEMMDENYYLSTHDFVLTIDGKQVNSYQKHPKICLLWLKPGERISFKAKAILGTASKHATWEATTNVISRPISDTEYEIEYETLGQLTEIDIFNKACIILVKKLKNLEEYLREKINEIEQNENGYYEEEILGENEALGNMIATSLQKCTLIAEAGYYVPQHGSGVVFIRYRLYPDIKKKPRNIFCDTLLYCIKVLNNIRKGVNSAK